MVDQSREKLDLTIFLIAMVSFLLVLLALAIPLAILYQDHCRNCCNQNSSERRLDETQVIFYLRKEASETTECHQEDQISCNSVTILKDQCSV